jgi:hypothetical protein
MTDERDDHLVRSGVGRPPLLDGNLRRPPASRREQHARHHPERLAIRIVRIEESAAIKVLGASGHVPDSGGPCRTSTEWPSRSKISLPRQPAS